MIPWEEAMLGKFTYIWKCPSDSLDLVESQAFAAFIEKNKEKQNYGEYLLIDLEDVKFVTLLGIISLSSIISRAVTYGFTINISLPNSESAKIFIHYFGFIDILDIPRQANAVAIPGKVSLKKPRNGKKVFSSKPIYGFRDADQFINLAQIKQWINQLDTDTKDSDFFRTGKFSRFVSGELGLNIVTHAELPTSDRDGRNSFGVIGMRVIKHVVGEDDHWIYKTFPDYRNFVSKSMDTGFVEVCICDPGKGIRNALEHAYKSRIIEKHGFERIPEDLIQQTKEIIEFAFDEFGTSKTNEDQWVTDAHALSRILALVNAYNGILEVTTSNTRVMYRLNENVLTKNESKLGYRSTEAEPCVCPFGTNIRIIVPLTIKSPAKYPTKLANIASGNLEYSIVPIATEYENGDLIDVSKFVKKTDLIGTFIAEFSNTQMIVLDFSDCKNWRSDHFASLIDRLWNILNGRRAAIVGIDSALAQEIEARCYDSAQRAEVFYNDLSSIAEHGHIHYLSCLTDIHQVLIAVDTEGTIYWFGCIDPATSFICSRLLEKRLSIEDIESETYFDCKFTNNILSVFSSTSTLFESMEDIDGKIMWESKIDVNKLELLRGKILVKHLERHLRDVSEALWGMGGGNAFLLPHSKKYVDMFIEATRLLQEAEFCREVGEVLARLIWVSLQKSDPTVIIATTAPSLLLSNAIRPWFKNLPLIVDIGHYFDSPKKKVLESLSLGPQKSKVIIIQDITHSGQTLNEICNILESNGSNVDAVVTLIECSCEVSLISPGGIRNVIINGKEKALISLYRYPMPRPLTLKEIKNINEDKIYWIEPYSLHPFKIMELKKAHHQYLRGENPTIALGSHIEKLKDLEENDVLRFGHYVYENHHFSLVTRMLRLFEKSTLADKLVDEILAACDAVSGELTFIFPLHSHIRYLVPRILDRLSSRSIKSVYFFPVVARELGQKPYYMPPHRLEKLLASKYASRLSSETTKKLNIVIVDDTTASLRTFETILRSVYLAAGKTEGSAKTISVSDIINKIDVWAIINRTGRAKSTFLYSVQNWLGVPFSFHCYAEYDIPVYEDGLCPICQQYRTLSLISKVLQVGSTISLKAWVDEQLKILRPVIVDSPAFDQLPPEYFPNSIEFVFGSYSARSLPLACLIFLEVAERGCPARYLIGALHEFTRKAINDLDNYCVSVFREFIFSWLIVNWKKVASDASIDDYFDILDIELTIRPKTALKLLLTCTTCQTALPEKIFDQITRKVILKLATLSAVAKRSPTIENMEAREIIFNAIMLFKAAISVNNPDSSYFETKLERLLNDLPDEPVTPGDFQGSIKDVVNAAFTFLQGGSVSILECIKLSSMELLIPPRRASGAARIHCNRIYKHLREIISPDSNEEYAEIVIKIKGSVGFLDVRSKLLCDAISHLICERLDEPSDIRKELDEVRNHFKMLILAISNLRISGLYINEIVSTEEFKLAQHYAIIIQEKLFSKSCLIYREIDGYNVKYWQLISEIGDIAKNRKVSNRLKLPMNEFNDSHTVFAEEFELMNFLINHTVDVLERHPEINITISVSEYCSGETLLISITSFSADGNSRKNIYEGHGFRFERWGLKRFGGDIQMKQSSSESEVTIACQLLHGYV